MRRQALKDFDTMLAWFEERTKLHIRLVQKYCQKIFDYDANRFKGIIERGKKHDKSKFNNPERDPYVLISWRYKCKRDKYIFEDYIDKEFMEEANREMLEASEHHIRNNAHHPEFHTDQSGDFVNKDDRDKPPPDKVIDATKMNDLDIAEMVADWCSMSEERLGDPVSWADSNVNVRWAFTNYQKKLIYELIDKVWQPSENKGTPSIPSYRLASERLLKDHPSHAPQIESEDRR